MCSVEQSSQGLSRPLIPACAILNSCKVPCLHASTLVPPLSVIPTPRGYLDDHHHHFLQRLLLDFLSSTSASPRTILHRHQQNCLAAQNQYFVHKISYQHAVASTLQPKSCAQQFRGALESGHSAPAIGCASPIQQLGSTPIKRYSPFSQAPSSSSPAALSSLTALRGHQRRRVAQPENNGITIATDFAPSA